MGIWESILRHSQWGQERLDFAGTIGDCFGKSDRKFNFIMNSILSQHILSTWKPYE